jgi:uncharacterized protein (DUF697 family)
MTDNQTTRCHGIIHTASAAAAAVGGGLAQIPGSDNAVIIPIQVAMTISLGQVFGISFTESAARAALATAATSLVGRTISQILIGWLPGVGNIINASTAAAITEATGWTIANDLAKETGTEGAA